MPKKQLFYIFVVLCGIVKVSLKSTLQTKKKIIKKYFYNQSKILKTTQVCHLIIRNHFSVFFFHNKILEKVKAIKGR